MKTEKIGKSRGIKVLIVIIGTIVVAGFVLGVFDFKKRTQESQNDIPADIVLHIASKRDLIAVHEPLPLSVISSPFTIKGEARGFWFFEANFSVVLTDWDGRIIAQHYASAQLNPDDPDSTWMTTEFVPFIAELEFESPVFEDVPEEHFSRRGYLILQKANPSGLPENDDALEIPILFE